MSKHGGYLFYSCAICLFFVFNSLLTAQEQPVIPQQVLDWQKAAQDFAAQNNTAQAVEYCKKIIQSNPDTAYALDAQMRIVTMYLQGNQADKATAALTEMKQKYASRPEYAKVMSQTAYEYRKAGFHPRAMELYNDVLSLNPTDDIQLNCKAGIAQVYLGQGDTANALLSVEQVKSSLRSCKGSIRIEEMEDMVRLTDAGQTAVAKEVCGALFERFPDDPFMVWVLQRKARSEVWTKRSDVADATVKIMQQKYANHPEYAGVMSSTAYEYRRAGFYPRAMELYNGVLSLNPAPEIQLSCRAGIAQAYLGQGDTANALQAAEQVKKDLQSCTKFQMEEVEQMISGLADAGQAAAAEGICDILLARFPEDPRMIWIIQRKIRSHVWMKQPDLADATLKIMQQKYASHPYYADALSWTAYEYWKAGFYSRATELYNDILSLKPGQEIQMRCMAGMARMYARLGDDVKVQEKVKDMLSNFKDNPVSLGEYLFNIGEEYYYMAEDVASTGDPNRINPTYQKAMAVWQQFEQAMPNHNNPQSAYFSGIVCQKLGRYEEAVVQYQRVVEKWPWYDKAWHAQYMIANCCEELAMENKVPSGAVKAAYQRLIENYPESSAAKRAVRKLGTL
jgi:tetratricopeptide (TPR) repeat protein